MTDGVDQRTSTEVVLAALDGFAESEPQYLLIVWRDQAGDIAFARSQKTDTTMQLGLLEAAKMMIGGYLGAPREEAK